MALFLFELGVLMAGFRHSLAGNGDFSAFYRTAVMVRANEFHKLYDPENQLAFDQKLFPELNRFPPYYFYHPPFEAVLLLPFAWFSYRAAFWIWSTGSLLSLCISGALLGREFPELQCAFKIPLAFLLLIFFPVMMVLLQGQDSALLLLLVTCAFSESNRGRKWSAGVLLALGLFKFQFVLPLAAVVAWRMGRKFLIAFSATSIVLLAFCWLLVGTAGLASYGRMLVAGTPELAWRMPNVRGVIETIGGSPILAIALSVVLIAWCALRVAQMDKGWFALAVVCSLLVSYHSHVYDCILLVIPAFYALERAIAEKKKWMNFWPALLFVMLPAYVLLTLLHATWIFALLLLLLAFTIAELRVSADGENLNSLRPSVRKVIS